MPQEITTPLPLLFPDGDIRPQEALLDMENC